MGREIIKRSVGIHDGTFHADEVSACALLLLTNLIDKDKIVRTRNPAELARCEFVCDVGGVYDPKTKLFDHHQSEYVGELSSAGMILRYLKDEKIISADEFDALNTSIIKGVDEHDNGKSPQDMGYCSFSHVIANFNPISYEESADELKKAFFQALEFTYGHLKRYMDRFHYNIACRKVVGETMKKYRQCLIFDQAIPWLESFFALEGVKHPAFFVMMPAGSHWKLRGIPPDYEHRMQVRLPLPKEWAGLLEDDLKRATKIKGAMFCHKGRFTSVWETKQDALEALQIVLSKNGLKDENVV
jgi:uncharacterized UPF0160 family protein